MGSENAGSESDETPALNGLVGGDGSRRIRMPNHSRAGDLHAWFFGFPHGSVTVVGEFRGCNGSRRFMLGTAGIV